MATKMQDTYKIPGESIHISHGYEDTRHWVYLDVTNADGHKVKLGFKPKHLRRFIEALENAAK